jgi:DNA polymerase III delta prime subunit
VDFVDRWLRGERDLAPHLLLVGRTGSGKTTAARTVVMRAIRQYLHHIVVLDWDGEYVELPLPIYAPPFEVRASPPLVADALSEVERAEEGGHMVAAYLRKVLAAVPLEKAAERLRVDTLANFSLRGVLEAAVARLETVAKYVDADASREEANGLSEGVYLLSDIPSIWERAALQQFLAVYHVLARNCCTASSILVIEEGAMGARTTFLRHLLALARRRGVRIVFISHSMPPAEIRQNFELLLFDSDPELRRALRAAVSDNHLSPGECWWVRRDATAKKLRFKLPR